MTNAHNMSFFGQTAGILINTNYNELFLFIKHIKKKDVGLLT